MSFQFPAFQMYIASCTGNAKNKIFSIPFEISSTSDINAACRKDHVCTEFRNWERGSDNFIRCYAVQGDCDNDDSDDPAAWITPDIAAERMSDTAFYAVKSRNCDKVKHPGEQGEKSPRPRWHYYFPLRVPVEDINAIRTIMAKVLALFPEFDRAGMKPAQFFYGHADPVAEFHHGEKDIVEFFNEHPEIADKPAQKQSDHSAIEKAYKASLVSDKDDLLRNNLPDILKYFASDDYDDWVFVGIALKSAESDYYREWNEWSKQSNLYPGEDEAWRKWNHDFKADGKTGPGSLFYEAKKRGWEQQYYTGNKEVCTPAGSVPAAADHGLIVHQAKKVTEEKKDDYKPLTIVSAFDLNSHEYKKPDYIVDGILYPGLTILAGPPKYGKSFLSLDLACSVASGSDFLGKLTKQGEVLYLDLEGTEWRTNERLAQLGYSLCPDLLDHTYEADTVDHNLIRQLTEQIESKSNPKLMIIDTMARIKGKTRRGEDGYAAEYRFLFPLHELALKKSVAIVCVTHTRKSGAVLPDDPMELIIGSTAQYGTADNGWVLTGKREEATKILHCSGRDYEGIDLEIEFSGGKWIPQGTVEEMEQKRSEAKYDHDPTIKTIIHLVQSSGGAWRGTMQELINEVALFTGVYPAADGTRLAKSIRPYVDLLLKRNHIVTLFPSSPRNVNGKSRKEYVFRQTGFAG
ncbi:MAG: AAA family ATPase [Clostridia bacterium]|nr:AAA family ATPase [Clostridia bacterium]